MEIQRNFNELQSLYSPDKFVSSTSTSLKIDIMSCSIDVALKSFINYDKVAIVTRHSIRGSDYSASAPLTDLGKHAAAQLGEKLRDIFGPKTVQYFSTNMVRTKDTIRYINGGWNYDETPTINTSKTIIDGGYFNLSGDWHSITEQCKTTAVKNKVDQWRESFISQIPDGISWWVTHDSLLVPIIYNTEGFDLAKYKDAFNLTANGNLWISPLTGIIIAIKGETTFIKIVNYLTPGFILDNDYDHDYSECIEHPKMTDQSKVVATSKSHPSAAYSIAKDLDYIFDKSLTANNPLYCTVDFGGCGRCNNCQTCDGGCQTACQNCDSCDSCQTCVSCQTVCQTSGYSRQEERIVVPIACGACNQCDTCASQHHVWYRVDCYRCDGCNNDVGTCSGCHGSCYRACYGQCASAYGPVDYDSASCGDYRSCTTCNSCNGSCRSNCYSGCTGSCNSSCYGCFSVTTPVCHGCNSETEYLVVPGCEQCYKGCTSINAVYFDRWHCDSLCMTCVGIDDYACSACYGTNNYDRLVGN